MLYCLSILGRSCRAALLSLLFASLSLTTYAADDYFSEHISARKYFPESGEMADATRRRLARRLLGNNWIADAELDEYLTRINKLLTPEDDYLITVANTEAVNAFAHYGGVIVMYKGLWFLAEEEDGFLGVIAHEMGHVELDHFQKQQDKAETISTISAPLLIAGLLVGDNEAKEALIIGSSGIVSGSIYAYSRELEHEADVHGLDLMIAAKRNGQAMARIFARLGSSKNEYLSTHPASDRRGAYLKDRLHTVETPPPSSDLSFYLLREKLSFGEVSKRDFLQSRRLVLEQEAPNSDKAVIARYGLLLLATKNRDKALSEEMSAALAARDHPYIIRALAENKSMQGDYEGALAQLTAARRQHPQHPALALAQMDTLLRAKNYAETLTVYDALAEDLRDRPDILTVAGRAAAFLKKNLLSNYLLARSYAMNGNYEQAGKQITLAEKFKGTRKLKYQITELGRQVTKELKNLE